MMVLYSFLPHSSIATRLLLVRPLSTTSAAFPNHQLNLEKALKKSNESDNFASLSQASVSVLQGIGPVHLEAYQRLGLNFIQDLANYKFYKTAKALVALAAMEGDYRPASSTLNVNNAVDKAYETFKLNEITKAPVAALQGISEEKGAILKSCGIVTVADLAHSKYFQIAESFVELAKYEEK